jgi:Arylsulfotransferase (ASST)
MPPALENPAISPGVARTLGHSALAAVASVAIAWAAPAAASGSSGAWSFVSAPKLHPPKLQVLERKAGLAPGDLLVANGGGSGSVGQGGPLIIDNHADPVWFRDAGGVLDFEQQSYGGKPILVFSYGRAVKVVDERYRVVATVTAGAPWTFDGHDAWIIGKDIWVTVIRQASGLNLTAYGGPANGSVIDCGLQEYDLGNGRLIRTWDALNHVPLSTSEEPVNPNGIHSGGHGPVAWDAYHLNSVQALANGDLLVSMRNTWAVYLIDPAANRIVWVLGGKASTFKLGSGASFAWQHDARLVNAAQGGEGSDVELTLFNDDNGGPTANPSEGMILSLDTTARAATLVDAYPHQPPLSAGILGSMQLLPNGNALVGWGSEPFFSEYSKSGAELLDVRWPGGDRSYRALFTNTWVGTPDYPPDGAVRGTTVYASWNGATQVARWEVLAGSTAAALKVIATRARSGFETAIKLGKTYGAYEVRALSSGGRALGTSKPFA